MFPGISGKSALRQQMQRKLGGVLGCQCLARLFVVGLVPIGPIADRFDQQTVDLVLCGGDIQARALHFAADRVWLTRQQCSDGGCVIDQLFAREQQPELYPALVSISVTVTSSTSAWRGGVVVGAGVGAGLWFSW